MKIAVFGSRNFHDLSLVDEYLKARFDPSIVLMSGGAKGVDERAETVWQSLGGPVVSLRVKKLQDDSYGYERWDMGERMVWTPDQLSADDWTSALFLRSWIMADEADRGVAFWDGESRGTSFTIDRFNAQVKPVAIHR